MCQQILYYTASVLSSPTRYTYGLQCYIVHLLLVRVCDVELVLDEKSQHSLLYSMCIFRIYTTYALTAIYLVVVCDCKIDLVIGVSKSVVLSPHDTLTHCQAT